jgi:uncharacterized protein
MTTIPNRIKHTLCLIFVAASAAAFAGSFDDFFSAIRLDNASAVADLLRRGFDPNTRDAKGQPGLVIAMQEHSLKSASSLLKSPDLQVDVLNSAGESALMTAAIKGDLEGVQLLLDHGAKVDQPGWDALHYAATGPAPSVVKLLLDRGAAIDAPSPNGSTPLMMAAQYGSEDAVKLLLQRGADAKRRNQLDLSAVDFAKRAGRDSVARMIEQAEH